MKIEELISQTPEMSEEKLFEIMDKHKNFFNVKSWSRGKYNDMKQILDEWDLIQMKKSHLTRSQREQICSFVSYCLVRMTHGESDGEQSTGSDRLEPVSES